VTPNQRHLGKSLARGHEKGLVDQCFSDPETYKYIMKKFQRTVHAEVMKMCSKGVESVLQRTSYETLKNFRLVLT